MNRQARQLVETIPHRLYGRERQMAHDLGFRVFVNVSEEIDQVTGEHGHLAVLQFRPDTQRARDMLRNTCTDGKDAAMLEVNIRFPGDLSMAPMAIGDAFRHGLDMLKAA